MPRTRYSLQSNAGSATVVIKASLLVIGLLLKVRRGPSVPPPPVAGRRRREPQAPARTQCRVGKLASTTIFATSATFFVDGPLPCGHGAGMTITEYLAREGLSHAEFARRLGVEQSTVSRWVSGERRPEWPQLARLRKVTGGAVQPNDFLEDKA